MSQGLYFAAFLVALLLLAVPAAALPSGEPYAVVVNGSAAGTLSFDFDATVASACRYVGVWDYGHGGHPEQCTVDEKGAFGAKVCFLDALGPVPALVMASIGEPCWGFDGSGQDTSVFTLMLLEQADGALDGLLQFDGVSTPISSFHASLLW